MPQDKKMEQVVAPLPEQRGWGSTPWGARIGTFMDHLVETLNPIPEDPTDPMGWGMELAPVGKAVGLIPPKYVRPLVNRLKEVVLNRPSTPYKDVVEEYIDRYPQVAAGLDNIDGFTQEESMRRPYASGMYYHSTPEYVEYMNNPATADRWINRSLNEGSPLNSGAEIKLSPKAIEKTNTMLGFEALTPQGTMRHEMTHAAQDAFTPFVKRPNVDDLPYLNRPVEVGAFMAQSGKRMPLEQRLKEFFNGDTLGMSPLKHSIGRDKIDMIQMMNPKLRHQGLQLNIDPLSGQIQVNRVDPKVVLDLP